MKQLSEKSLELFETLSLDLNRAQAKAMDAQSAMKLAECALKDHLAAMRREAEAPTGYAFNQATREFVQPQGQTGGTVEPMRAVAGRRRG